MLMKIGACLSLILTSSLARPESSLNLLQSVATPVDSSGLGIVNFVCSPGIQSIEKGTRGLNNLNGFRIQIFFGPLDQAKQKRQEYMGKGMLHQAYLEQNVPDFSLRIGDFLTESEARQELRNIRGTYPNAFLVKGHIEPPNLNYYINAIKDYEN